MDPAFCSSGDQGLSTTAIYPLYPLLLNSGTEERGRIERREDSSGTHPPPPTTTLQGNDIKAEASARPRIDYLGSSEQELC